MIQLRPYFTHNTERKLQFLIFYNNTARYRNFRTTYLDQHLVDEPVPHIGGAHIWQARGEELVFLYFMPWYFQTPNNNWMQVFKENIEPLADFVNNG